METSTISVTKPDVLLFGAQILLIFIIVCTSLLNLTLQWGNQNLWTVVLTGTTAYLMPNPKLKLDKQSDKDKISNHSL